MRRIGSFLVVGAMILFGSNGAAVAQNAAGLSPVVAAPVATDPAKDAGLKTYLQKHFKIPSAALINSDPLSSRRSRDCSRAS